VTGISTVGSAPRLYHFGPWSSMAWRSMLTRPHTSRSPCTATSISITLLSGRSLMRKGKLCDIKKRKKEKKRRIQSNHFIPRSRYFIAFSFLSFLLEVSRSVVAVCGSVHCTPRHAARHTAQLVDCGM